MRIKKLAFPSHPLTKFFQPAAESVTTSLSESSIRCYRYIVRSFLLYLGAHYPAVHSLDQLRRDPHLLGWLALLRSHNPPRAPHTRARDVIHLRRMLEELAWTQQIPALAHLLVGGGGGGCHFGGPAGTTPPTVSSGDWTPADLN
jgi:hypothetical protein